MSLEEITLFGGLRIRTRYLMFSLDASTNPKGCEADWADEDCRGGADFFRRASQIRQPLLDPFR